MTKKNKIEAKKIVISIGVIFLQLYATMVYGQEYEKHAIEFYSDSDMLYDHYSNNSKNISAARLLISYFEDVILTGNGHIRFVAPIGSDKKEDPVAINLAALRATAIRNSLKGNFRMLTDWSFTFYLDTTRLSNNTIEINYIPQTTSADVSSEIHCTGKKNNLSTITQTLAKYGKLPYLSDAPAFLDDTIARAHFDKINAIATQPVDGGSKEGESYSAKKLFAIHYRWDKDNLDSLYLSNPQNLHLLDSILTSVDSAYINTLTIVAYASPEGQPDHNQRLSERRAKTIKNYIKSKYTSIAPEQIIIEARGENWDGLRNFVIHDNDLPSRDEVLKIIDSPLPSLQKQSLLTKLNGGVIYYRYILPNYYRYLRNGAFVLISYKSDLPPIPFLMLASGPGLRSSPPEPELMAMSKSKPIVKYPIALRTNLLFDAIGAPNIGIEMPIGDHFSVLADFAYAYWRSPKNLYALQTLEWGVEGRYWFGVNEKKKLKNAEWSKPLRGWNAGVYGMYCSRYDVQWTNGYQGDGFWSMGLTAGHATPIARNLALEFSLAAGYFYTPEYRHYHQPEYDTNGKYHLMWQQTGNFGTFTLTKARISLVWLIRSTKKKGVQE